jgi:hypothetical protein
VITLIDVSIRSSAILFREQQNHPTSRKKLLAKSTLKRVRGNPVVKLRVNILTLVTDINKLYSFFRLCPIENIHSTPGKPIPTTTALI